MNPDTTSIAGAMMNCDQVSKGEFAEKYIRGQLTAADQEAYERHFFECAECFKELQTCRTVQAELKRSAGAIRADRAKQHFVWHWSWAAVAATVVIVASLGIWQSQRSRRVAPGQLVAVSPPHQTSPVPSLSELASVQPPAYAPVIIRGTADEATQKFNQAMRQYTRGNYATCMSGLQAALKLDPDAPGARFYLGISYLLTSNNKQAIEELRRTAELGDTPYLDGAHFYLAKAYLRENDLTHAEVELKKTIGIHRNYEVEAGSLLRELRSVREGQH